MKMLTAILVLAFLAQPVLAAEIQPDLLTRKVPQFSYVGTIDHVVSELARSLGACSSCESLSRRINSKSVEKPCVVSISVEDKTVKEIMDALVAKDKRYTYLFSGDWINLVPREVASDPDYIFNRRIPGQITVSNESDKSNGISSWAKQNKMSSALLIFGDPSLRLVVEPQTVTLTNPTLREHENWRLQLAGKNRWSAECERTKDGGWSLLEQHWVICNSELGQRTTGAGEFAKRIKQMSDSQKQSTPAPH
jgi:hypothetical protein